MFYFLLFSIFVFCSNVHNSLAVINRIDRIEHARMPPVVSLDKFDACLLRNNGTGEYCSVSFNLVSDEPNDLYKLITEYSAKREKHFNHTKLFYGICLSKTCQHFYNRNTTAVRERTLEECLNKTFCEEYQLKSRVTEVLCQSLGRKQEVDSYDYMVAVAFTILLVLNLLGSLQVFFFGDEREAKGSAFLSCFSVGRNWRKLIAPAGNGSDPRLRRLVGFNGIKAICTLYIVTGHSVFPLAFDAESPYFIEQGLLNSMPFLIFATCGLLIVQWCFLVSSFLLFYNMELYAETHKITWKMLPKALIMRWLRFSPAYAVALAYSATWMRHYSSGPFFKEGIMEEVDECRRHWWINLLYINNYVRSDKCFRQSWYIAADFQLFFLGMAVYVFTAGARRRLILALLFVVGVLIPGALTFIEDLDGTFLFSPENIRTIGADDPTMHSVYIKTHTNLPSYITGLALGLLVFHLQKIGYQVPKTGGVRFLYWLTIPFAVIIGYFGGLLYEGQSLFYRTMYAGLVKPLWALNGAFFIFGMVNQFEDVYRGIVEWRGWTVPSRLSYSLFLVHFIVIRLLIGTRTTTMDTDLLHMLEMMTSTITMSFLAAVPFHLLVEAPFNQLVKLWSSPSDKQIKLDDKMIMDENGNCNNISGVRRRLVKPKQ
ncbi:hypothetical protein NE865_01717 [Phthorimaea operculella]|nr:hypothetical protein NE865_01717 [Phthorimaea operculella]